MNSFSLIAVGNLASDPELAAGHDVSYARLCLIGNDCADNDDAGSVRDVTTSLWFTAFGALAETLAQRARKGDQLVLEAHVRGSNWTDKHGELQYDHAFIIDGFRLGATGKARRTAPDVRRDGKAARSPARAAQGETP